MLNDSIVTTLHEILAEKVGKNHRYSMRTLAKHLGISHPYLSRIISRRRKMSPALRKKMEKKLRVLTGRAELRLEGKRKNLSVDEALKVLHWKYFAILKLIQARGFVSSPAWIARRLHLSESVTKEAITLLKEMGLIVLGPRGKLIRTYDTNFFDPTAIGEKNFQHYFLSYFDLVTKFIGRDS